MHSKALKVITTVFVFVSLIIAVTNIVISADVSTSLTRDDANNPPTPPLEKGGKGGFEGLFSSEKRIHAPKGIVAFIELSSPTPSDLYLLYQTQYNKYKESGSLEGVLEFKEITWLFYPIPALLEDQTVYIITKGEVKLNIAYENIQERLDRLFAGEEQLRAGTEMSINSGISIVRLTPLIPGIRVRLDFTENAQFVIVKTIDLARYKKGLKSFDQLYKEYELKGSSDHFNFSNSDFEDLYMLVRTDKRVRLKYLIWATKESAESGC